MIRIAAIGSGISGMAAAYYLSRKHEVLVFEKESRAGGHTHTVTVESGRGPLAVDTRWWTQACASCGAPAGCTTVCEWSSARFRTGGSRFQSSIMARPARALAALESIVKT